jgi:hypothetical protein
MSHDLRSVTLGLGVGPMGVFSSDIPPSFSTISPMDTLKSLVFQKSALNFFG